MKFYDKNGKEFTNGCLVFFNNKNYDLSMNTSGINLSNDYEEITIESKLGNIFNDIEICSNADKPTDSLFKDM